MSKVLEKIVTEQLLQYLEGNNLLHPLQFGFRHNHSTETATCLFLEQVKQSLDKGNIVGAVFLDLKRAFDTVNHDLLVSKLVSFNFSERSISWFQSYLVGREQCTVINSYKSSFRTIQTGIPQGTILGPILFSLYINNLPEVCPEANLQMYADDTVVHVSGKTSQEVNEKLNQSLIGISSWLQNSCLTLNTSKTKCICFSITKAKNASLQVQINGESIEQVSEQKYLGIILDSQLNFRSHVKKMCKTIRSNINCFKLIRKC